MIESARLVKRNLHFKKAASTSRGSVENKISYFILLRDSNGNTGLGECSPIHGLSVEDPTSLESEIFLILRKLESGSCDINRDCATLPSLAFALESAILDLKHGGSGIQFPSSFTRGEASIRINGLIWINTIDGMKLELREKIEKGFTCIKIKIGAHKFGEELKFLKYVRHEYGEELEIRLDANGAFGFDEAAEKLRYLSEYNIHSIEQPIKAGQWQRMADLCGNSPIPITLDEELIGVQSNNIIRLLESIRPTYIIIKPTLIGSFRKCEEWIDAAKNLGINWWSTSALESNVGLSAIAQWTAKFEPSIPQGLGTGELFVQNIPSPLHLSGETLWYNPDVLRELPSTEYN